MRRRGMPRNVRAAGLAALAVVAFVGAVLTGPVLDSGTAEAAAASDFQAGNIISDEVFYNTGTMSAGDIQSFIASKEPSCTSGYTCLKNYSETMGARGGDKYCGAVSGGAMSAAQIIYTVSQACGINPQALIVTLEKEEALISSRAPSTSQYRIAMGYACPDSAPCDAQYYGFSNQVYSAAHQFQVYRLNPGSFNYRPNQNNYIQWNPNAGCGGSTVYIQNSATAALYNYTPYQPNAAALGNLYGLGDGCSAYGNRNFWRTFVDWFGDTHGGGSLVLASGSPNVYLVVGTVKHLVPDASVLQQYMALGPYHTVSSNYLSSLTSGATLANTVRDPGSGAIYFVDSSGARHKFSTCDQMAALGFSCSAAVDLESYQLGRLPLGQAMTLMVKKPDATTVYYVDGTTLRPVPNWSTAQALNGKVDPYIYLPPTSFFSSHTVGQSAIAPATLVKSASSPMIYLVDGIGTKIPVSSFATTSELGISGYSVQPDAVLDAYSTAPAPLTIALDCAGTGYVAGSGTLTTMSGVSSTGIPVTKLDALTCLDLRTGGPQLGQKLFLNSSGGSAIYAVVGGKLRHVTSMQMLAALNGGSQPHVVTESAATIAGFAQGSDLLMPGTLVKTSSSPSIYLIDGAAQKIPVSSFAVTSEYGINGYSVQSDAAIAGYSTAGTALSLLAKCQNTYLAASGQLVQLNNASDSGLPVTPLDSATCASLHIGSSVVPGRLFVKTASSNVVFYVTGAKAYPINSAADLLALANGSMPTIPVMSAAGLATIPTAHTIVAPGQLVKATTSSDIWLIDGLNRKYHLDSFNTEADLGLPTAYTSVSAAVINGYPTGGGTALHDVVACNGKYLVGAGGKVYALGAGNDFSGFATALDALTCAKLPGTLSQPDPGGMFVKGSGSVIYQLLNGQKLPVSSMERLNQLAGDGAASYETMSDPSLNAIPTGPAT